MKKAIAFLLLFLPVFACFSIGDLSAVEIETKTNVKPLLNAKNVMFENGAFYFKIPNENVLIKVTKDRVRIIFPVEEVNRYYCRGETEKFEMKCEAEHGGIGGREYYTIKNGTTVLNAYFNGKIWEITLEYEQNFPEWIKRCTDPPPLNCSLHKVPRVIEYNEKGVKKVVKETLEFTNKAGITHLSKEDIEEIVNVSRLGNAGHNGRIVKEGKWKPYYETSNPILLKSFVEGGCGSGREIKGPRRAIELEREKLFSILCGYLIKFFRFNFLNFRHLL